MTRNILSKYKLLIILLFSLLFASALPAYAITKGYLSDDAGLLAGMVVQLSNKSEGDPKVERATLEKADHIIGVATTVAESPVTIASGEQSVYVETSGDVSTFVSDINGEVKKGDLLTISPLNGILTKYIVGSESTFGLAMEDAVSKPSEAYTIQTPEGEKSTNVAKIQVNLDQKNLDNSSKSLSALEKFGQSVTGKQVSELRVIVGLIIFIIVLIAEAAILYGSISSAVTSIGRNPLASKTVKRELLKVMVMAALAMLVGLGAVYVVLWV